MPRRTATALILAQGLLFGAAATPAAPAGTVGTPAAWATTFPVAAGGSQGLHLQAISRDAKGQPHVLEFWRDGQGRVVRRTDGRVELRLTPSADDEDAYEVRDLKARVVYHVHRVNLFRIGIFTDRWSTQHLLDQPRGAYTLTRGTEELTASGLCSWVRIGQGEGNALDVCWSEAYGVPLIERRGTQELLRVQTVQRGTAMLPDAILPDSWQEFNADEDIAPD